MVEHCLPDKQCSTIDLLNQGAIMHLSDFLAKQTSKRKLRLFSVACCNEILHLLKDQRSINAIIMAELYADGLATKKQLNAATDAAAEYAATDAAAEYAAFAAFAAYAAYATASAAAVSAAYTAASAANAAEAADIKKRQQQIAEDIFHQSKLTIPTSRSVQAIAQSIYTDKCWIDMPILADALEDAGCLHSELLDHLRSNQSHVKGCWALDLILAL